MQNNERNLRIGHNWFGMMSEWNVFIPNFFIIVKILHVLEKLFVFNLEMEIPYRMKFFFKGCYWRKKQVFDQWK